MKTTQKRKIPGPPGDCAGAFDSDALGFLERCAREYGDYVAFQLGPYRVLLVNDPFTARELFAERRGPLARGPGGDLLVDIMGRSIVTDYAASWHRRHAMMQPALAPREVRGLDHIVVDEVSKHIARWTDGEDLDMLSEMTELAYTILNQSFFSGEAECLRELVACVLEVDAAHSSTMYAALSKERRDERRAALASPLRELDEEVGRLIAGRRSGAGKTSDLVDGLLAGHDNDDDIRNEIVSMLWAGHTTTATTLTWGFILLGRDAPLQERIADEVRETVGDRPVSGADVKAMSGIRHMVEEELRLYSSLWIIMRTAAADLEVEQWTVSAGTVIAISPWLIHRDERFFRDAACCRPSRFARESPRFPREAYIPFGSGPRICPGRHFALLEEELVMASILQRFKLICEGNIEPWASSELRPRGKAIVRVSAR